MIHDAEVEVTCDGWRCLQSISIALPAGSQSTYLFNEQSVERKLKDAGWIVKDGKHYCQEECAQ